MFHHPILWMSDFKGDPKTQMPFISCTVKLVGPKRAGFCRCQKLRVLRWGTCLMRGRDVQTTLEARDPFNTNLIWDSSIYSKMVTYEPTIHKSVYFGDMPYSHLGATSPSSHHSWWKSTLNHPTTGHIISIVKAATAHFNCCHDHQGPHDQQQASPEPTNCQGLVHP